MKYYKKISSFVVSLRRRVTNFFKRGRGGRVYRRSVLFAKRRPITAFVASLLLLLVIIFAGNLLSRPESEQMVSESVKSVEIYTLGESPTVTLQAQIEKKGVIEITALSGGVIQSIPVKEGETVAAGKTIINLSSNYSGASLPGLQTRLARTQYNNLVETYDTQKDIIHKQREVADKTNENTEELRKINEDSLSDTRSILDQNEDLLEGLNSQLEQLESTGADPATIFQTQQARAQLQSGVNQLRGTVRSLEYQTGDDNPPNELADLQKDLTLRQLDIQEKALDLNREVGRLQYQIAAVTESLLHPASPFEAVVERIHVQVGESVTPGTVLATISCTELSATAVINTPRKFALSISQLEPSVIHADGEEFEVLPTYISGVATDGDLYSVLYDLSSIDPGILDEGYIPIEVPIGYSESADAVPFIPIDAVYQGQGSAYVNLLQGGRVLAREVELGSVYGKYVEVAGGLKTGDRVILNRNVISGERATTK